MTKTDYLPDLGIARVRDFHEAFDCVITTGGPWMPELSDSERLLVQQYAGQLGDIAANLKVAAASANNNHRPALGLLLVRLQLAVEETGELAEAFAKQDLVEALDALSDIGYVNNGTYLTLGLQYVKGDADAEVHRSNMSKLGLDGKPQISAAGRVEKGPNYSPPDFSRILMMNDEHVSE